MRHKNNYALICILSVFLFVVPSYAVARTWVNGSSSFFSPGSWSPEGFDSEDSFLIENINDTIAITAPLIAANLILRNSFVYCNSSLSVQNLILESGSIFGFSGPGLLGANVTLSGGSKFATKNSLEISGSLRSDASSVTLGLKTSTLSSIDRAFSFCYMNTVRVKKSCIFENGTSLSIVIAESQTDNDSRVIYYSQLICEEGVEFGGSGTILLAQTAIGRNLTVAANATTGTVLQPLMTNSFDTLHVNATVRLNSHGCTALFDPINPPPNNCGYWAVGVLLSLVNTCAQKSRGTCSSPYYLPPDCVIPLCPIPCVHGSCTGNPSNTLIVPACNCDSNWSGVDCSLGICPGSPPCGGTSRGVCNSTSATPFCSCNSYFTGADCSIPICTPSCAPDQYCSALSNFPMCQNNFTAAPSVTSPVPVLTCSADWTGSDCSIPICNGNAQLSCSGQGICRVDRIPHYCECSSMFSGSNCEIPVCAKGCEINGRCILNSQTGLPQCECYNGWVGDACELTADIALALLNTTSPANTTASQHRRSHTLRTVAIVVGSSMLGVVCVAALVISHRYHRIRQFLRRRPPASAGTKYSQMVDMS